MKEIKKKNDSKSISMISKTGTTGITLIALVITIIVLLILSTISIAILTGENGILTKVNEAEIETRAATVDEEVREWKTEKWISKYDDKLVVKTKDELIEDQLKRKLLTSTEAETAKKESKVQIGNRLIIYEEEETSKIPVSELKIGDYVYYTTSEGNDVLCQVLYDNDYKSDGGKSYGIQVLTVEGLCQVTLGYDDPTIPSELADSTDDEKSKWSYDNSFKTLNNAVSKFTNPTLSGSALGRCFGTKLEEPFDGYEFSELTDEGLSYDKPDVGDFIVDLKRAKSLELPKSYYWIAVKAIDAYSAADMIGQGLGYGIGNTFPTYGSGEYERFI